MPPLGPSPAGLRGQFPTPPNLPNINFNAPVIRLGLDAQPERGGGGDRGGRDGRGPGGPDGLNRGRLGLGADGGSSRNLDRERQQLRENMAALQPLMREEVARTIFIGGLVPGAPSDEKLELILRSAGKLRRWTRGYDAEDKKCKFGFAEYEDVDSLEAATEIFPGVKVPLFDASGHVQKEEGEDGEVKMAQLLVVVDEQSKKYIEEWKGRRKEEDSDRQFRIDGCKEDLRQILASLTTNDPSAAHGLNGYQNGTDGNGDTLMGEGNGEVNGDGTEVVTIPVSLEDELADIPAEMRATVAEEIKAFRDRSNRRDLERLHREEEMEQEERRRSNVQSRNGVPAGPRGAVQGAPSGPKGFRGAQIPSDYANGVTFVAGVGPDGTSSNATFEQEDEDADESDEELERRRQEKADAELEKQYQDQVRRWQARERTRAAAQEREKTREEAEQRKRAAERDRILSFLEKWDDDKEARDMREEYYANRSAWVRRRAAARDAEARVDERDRQAEQREKAEERKQEAEARGAADDFLGSMGIGMPQKASESSGAPASGFGGFKINLGNAAMSKNSNAKAAPTQAATEIEGLLDDDDTVENGVRRPALKPLTDTSTVPLNGEGLTDQEKREAQRDLAAEMPTDTDAVFSYPIRWAALTPKIINDQLRPFIEKKVVYYLGVQEELLVDTLLDGVKEQRNPRDLVKELEPALEDDAESLVMIVWKLVALSAEVEGRGLAVAKR